MRNRAPTLTALLLTLAAMPAQQRPAISARDVAGVFRHDDTVVAVAKSWRASFGERGATFVPALGRTAPSAHELTVRTKSITRGTISILDTTSNAPIRTNDFEACTFTWPGVIEQFTATPAGLKHSYTLARRPVGEGDLVVRIAVDTTLQGDAAGNRFRDSFDLGIDIGPVVAIAADGRRCIGSKQYASGTLELRLPDPFVNEATYPLEIDPLISTATQAWAGTDNDFPDVAHDAASDSWCVVWTQFLGGGQTGIVGSVWLASPLGFGYAFGINQTGDEDSVRVTGIAGLGVYVIVWTNYEPAGNWISGLVLEPIQGVSSNVFPIDGPFDVSSPVVSGEATVLDDDCLVAWLDSSLGLLGTTVTVDAQLTPTVEPFVQIATGDVLEPAISKQGGQIGNHVITWTSRPIGQPGWIRAQVVDHDMNLLGPAAWIQNTSQNCGYSAVDGDGFKFLVAWEEQETGNPSTTDVRGKIITVDAAGITSIGGALDLRSEAGSIDYAVDVALLGDMFGIAYMVADPAAIFDDDCFARVVGPTGNLVGGELRLDVTPGVNYPYEHAPRIIGRRDGDPATTLDDGLVVFADQDTAATFDSDVGLQAIEAMGSGGAIVDLGGGCGPGGLAVCPGPVALGNTALPLELYGAEPLAIPFALIGLPGAPAACGVCTLVNPINAWFVPNTAGTATSMIAIPGSPTLIGFAFDVQFASFNVLYVGCPALPGIAASNIVRLTIDV